ncbi:MAG TPA: hypothetical protein VGB54_02725, partial [Allosphingosinicella sp.]
ARYDACAIQGTSNGVVGENAALRLLEVPMGLLGRDICGGVPPVKTCAINNCRRSRHYLVIDAKPLENKDEL